MSSCLTQEWLDPRKVFRPTHVLESDAGLGIEYIHLRWVAGVQVLGPSCPGEVGWGQAVSSENDTPTIPIDPWDSPDHILLHRAQLLRTEEAEVGRMEAGQSIQGGLI